MLLPIAKILNVHGIKGEVKVSSLITHFELFFQIKTYYIRTEEEPLEVENIRKGPGKGIFLIKFKDIDFELAKTFKNQILYVDIKSLPDLEEDEFYYYQIINFKVKDKDDNIWGEVKEIMPMGEYDLLLVKNKKDEEFYIPLVEEYVEEVDFKSKVILVKDIKGLVETQKS